MTDDERFSLLVSVMGTNDVVRDPRRAHSRRRSDERGLRPGRRRASASRPADERRQPGRHQPGLPPEGDTATALPAGLALGASFNPALARESGRDGRPGGARRGFNVHARGRRSTSRATRATGATSSTCPRTRCSARCSPPSRSPGSRREGVISTIKHFSLNCNETNRHWLDALIDPAAHRESDLLAFQIAIERSTPARS